MLATYLPTTPLVGAHLICERCPQGMNRIYIEDPPYGDARSFGRLAMFNPELAGRLARLTPAERATQWEAFQRGIAAEAAQPAIERAVRRARKGPPARALTPTQLGIQALILREVRSGEPVTSVIAELAEMARDHRAGYAECIARQIPEMQPYLENPPERIAELLTEVCGTPATSARALWSIWERIPEELRRDAQEHQREDAGPKTLQ